MDTPQQRQTNCLFAKSPRWRVLFLPSSASKYHTKFLGNENKDKALCRRRDTDIIPVISW